MFEWIYNYNVILIGVVFAIAPVCVMLLGIRIFNGLFRGWIHKTRSANDVIGYILSCFSALYGILVGLLAVGAYENLNSVGDIVSKEASNIAALYMDYGGYPEPIKSVLRNQLTEYANEVIEKSWPLQKQNTVPMNETIQLRKIFRTLVSFRPSNRSEDILHTETLRQYNALIESRRMRLENIGTSIPTIIWAVVLIGGLFHILLICMLDTEAHVHRVLGICFSSFIGLLIFMIAEIDNPYLGTVSVGPDAFVQILENIKFRPE
ncbi:MAG: DUF4239 domain-containing protein [Methylocystaceae bacterium]|jgi:tetrahydromethanopterin S-methyltransferase subunit G|nr:DUF4239 domain-containing protein [Methylocystaceae bacterium]